jgi:hypothetical protein
MSPIPLWAKVAAVAVALALLIGAYSAWRHHIYEEVYAAVAADNAKAVEKQKAADQKHHDDVAREVAPIQAAAQPKIEASITMTPVIVRTVTEYVHADPTFAACVRPAPVDRVRQQQLQALRAAAAASPFPARGSSAPLPAATARSTTIEARRH